MTSWFERQVGFDAKAAGAAVDVAVELDRREDRRQLPGDRRAVDVEDGGRFLLAAAEDRRQRLDLHRAGIAVDEALHHAAALVHRAGPAIGGRDLEPVQPQIAEPALVDAHAFKALAEPFGRLAVEFAWTVIIAAAGCDLRPLKCPIDVGHRVSPRTAGEEANGAPARCEAGAESRLGYSWWSEARPRKKEPEESGSV